MENDRWIQARMIVVNKTDGAAIMDHEGWNILGMMELKINRGPTGSTMKNESR